MKNWIERQFILNPNNLKAIGLGFLLAILASFIAGFIGLPPSPVGIVVWVYASYKYQKRFAKRKEQNDKKA